MFEVGASIQGLSRSYVVLGEHASGGMSRTFRARAITPPKTADTAVVAAETEVLLKVTSFGGMRDWRAFERFEREVRTLSSLSHPRIPKSIELFAWDGTTALAPANVTAGETPVALIHAQELVPGRSLAAAQQAGARFSAEELTTLYRELLETLCYLHALLPPVLHRDLQPRNVILDQDGHAHLVDFGLSLEAEAPAHSVPLGAPGYIAPELVLGIAGPKADLYALAATILSAASHLAATEFPRDAKSGKILVQKAAPGLPAALVRTLERSLELDLRKRTPTAKDVLESLSKRPSLASRVHVGNSRGRIAALGALGFVFAVVLPLGLKVRAHYKHIADVAAERALPSATSEDEARCGCNKKPAPDVEGDAPPATPTPESAEPRATHVEWTGSVVATNEGGPALDARCVLSLLEASQEADRRCHLTLTCGGPDGKVFDQLIGYAPEDGACVISQLPDTTPGHYTYRIRATHQAFKEDWLYVDSEKRVLRFTPFKSGARSEIRVRLDPEEQHAVPADLLGRVTTFAKPVRFHGTASGIRGAAPVAFGTKCVAEFTPRYDQDKNCSAEISCGGKLLYRKAVTNCNQESDGSFSDYWDHDASIHDGSPRVTVSGLDFFVADDTAEGSWLVGMEMEREKE